MAARFTVLASGSAGNCSLLAGDGYGLLVDCGLGPQELTNRLQLAGHTWADVTAVVLTHTHGDHVNGWTLAHLRRRCVPLICHARHADQLSGRREFEPMARAGLIKAYTPGDWYEVAPALAFRPHAIPHDAEPTFAFRFEGSDAATGRAWSLGFASDLGHVPDGLLAALAGVDVLAVEYNHDVPMQKRSRRPARLIERVLGSHGHLSNAQAGEFTAALAAGPTGLRAVVQLHLSRECNRPDLAAREGRFALRRHAPDALLVTAEQHCVAPAVDLLALPAPGRRYAAAVQRALPGF